MKKHEHKWEDHTTVCECPFCPVTQDCECGAYLWEAPGGKEFLKDETP